MTLTVPLQYRASLYVNPTNARVNGDVYVDGRRRGRTRAFVEVPLGLEESSVLDVQVRAPGFETFFTTVQFEQGSNRTIRPELVPAQGAPTAENQQGTGEPP
jgi:hypothetical protein